MQRPTIEEIHEVMHEQEMKVFTTPFDCTLGWIRTKDNKSGKFNVKHFYNVLLRFEHFFIQITLEVFDFECFTFGFITF